MERTVFDFQRVDTLRKAAMNVANSRISKSNAPGGWSKVAVNPMDLLAVFEPLRIKEGYLLRAYQLRAGGDGNGVVWAMPADASFPEPEECNRQHNMVPVPGVVIGAPRPPDALDDFMSVIEGDGSPWSYLCASLFRRETLELGARWHGVSWGARTILDGSPWEPMTGQGEGAHHPPSDRSEFTFLEPEPEIWGPTFERDGEVPVVTFHTYCGEGLMEIRRTTDRFEPKSYCFTGKSDLIAQGPMGYIT